MPEPTLEELGDAIRACSVLGEYARAWDLYRWSGLYWNEPAIVLCMQCGQVIDRLHPRQLIAAFGIDSMGSIHLPCIPFLRRDEQQQEVTGVSYWL